MTGVAAQARTDGADPPAVTSALRRDPGFAAGLEASRTEPANDDERGHGVTPDTAIGF